MVIANVEVTYFVVVVGRAYLKSCLQISNIVTIARQEMLPQTVLLFMWQS